MAGSTKASRGKRTHRREDGNEPDPLGLNMVETRAASDVVEKLVMVEPDRLARMESLLEVMLETLQNQGQHIVELQSFREQSMAQKVASPRKKPRGIMVTSMDDTTALAAPSDILHNSGSLNLFSNF